MSKWLSIELSLLLLVSLVAFAGLVSWQNTGDDLTGEVSFYRPLPKPIYVPPPQPVQQGFSLQQKQEVRKEVLNMFSKNCRMYAYEDLGKGKDTGNDVCKAHNSVCVINEFMTPPDGNPFAGPLGSTTKLKTIGPDWTSALVECDIYTNTKLLRTLCCN